jgi:hypothetical protein
LRWPRCCPPSHPARRPPWWADQTSTSPTIPRPAATRPQTIAQPEKPADTKDKAAVDAFNKKVEVYNAKVAVFNTAMHAFNDCMKTYVDNANSDMQRIKQAVDASQPAAH